MAFDSVDFSFQLKLMDIGATGKTGERVPRHVTKEKEKGEEYVITLNQNMEERIAKGEAAKETYVD